MRSKTMHKKCKRVTIAASDIHNAVTNSPNWDVKRLPQYGQPAEAPIIVPYACRSLDLWACTVDSTARCAKNIIRNYPRDSCAAVGTGCIVSCYLRTRNKGLLHHCKDWETSPKLPTRYLNLLLNSWATSETCKFIIYAAKEAHQGLRGSTRSLQNTLARQTIKK